MKAPRISPLAESELNDDTRELLEGLKRDGQVFNIFSTLARHPDLMKRWLVFGNHILAKSTLPARDRELVILRTGWLCRANYEWGHHVAIGKQVGLSDEEIKRIGDGPDAAGWNAFEASLLRAADELHKDSVLGDETWLALTGSYNTQQMMDLIFTVGQYHLVSMALNSLGVQLENGFTGLPE